MGTFDLWNTLSTTNEPYTDLLFDKDIDEYMYNSYDDYSFINADLCTLDTLDNTYRSIHDDIKQIESSSQSSISGSISPIHDNNDIDIKFELESKVEIRNVDCMWSGLGNLNNNTATTTTTTNIINSQNNDKKQQSQRTNQQQQQQQRQNSLTNNNSNSKNNNNNNGGNNNNNTINNSLISNKLSAKNIQNIPPGASLLINSFKREQKKSNISSSSLSSSNKYNNALSLTDGATIPNILTSDFLKDRETTIQQQQTINNNCTSSLSSSNTNINLTSLLARPDTPLSLDDDAPEFKHSVDLAACITGSNNICLDLNLQETNDKMIINKLKEQLEDTSTENIDIRQIIPGSNCNRKKRSLTEVLHAIGSIENDNYYNKNTQNCNSSSNSNSNSNNNNNNNNSNNNSSSNNNCHTQHNEHLQQQYIFSNGGINTAPESELSHSSSESEVDDDDDDCDEYDDTELSSSSCAMLNGNSNIFRTPLTSQFRKNNNYTTYIDHSYTRSNESNVDVVGIGLETPSDSDEEIDVVSVGDKKLPTNPSDKDRRALQNKVANKISARIVKTPNGIRTIPARKQRGNINGSGGDGGRGGGGGSGGGTFDPPYTIIPISNMVSSPIKSISVGNPRYNNNNNNDKNSQQQQQYSNNSNNITTLKSQQQQQQQSNSNSISAGRKRNNNGTILNKQQQQNDEYLPPSKKSRNNCSNSTINNSNNNSHTNSNSNSSNCSTSSNSSSSSNNNNNNHHHQHTNNSNNIKNNHNTNNNRKSTNGRRNYDMEEQDTIEKRNLHNDMERQRRIGLKNLFEELKKQIPSIKDKERAPKVHILREAAKLCEQLMLDEKTMLNQKNQLLMQIHRKKEYLDAKFE